MMRAKGRRTSTRPITANARTTKLHVAREHQRSATGGAAGLMAYFRQQTFGMRSPVFKCTG
jgi:hypothetical protein